MEIRKKDFPKPVGAVHEPPEISANITAKGFLNGKRVYFYGMFGRFMNRPYE